MTLNKTVEGWGALLLGIGLTALSYGVLLWAGIPYDFSWLEAVGVALNFACVMLVARQNILTWPWGILAVISLGVLFWNLGLYGSLALHIGYFFPIQFWGWYKWAYGNEKEFDSLPVTTLTKKQWSILLISVPFIFLALTGINMHLDGASPFLDTGIFVISIIAQYLLGLKKVESWIGWVMVNIIAIAVYSHAGAYLLTVQYAMFLANALYGLYIWYNAREKVEQEVHP